MARMMLPTRLVPLAAVLLACVAPLAAQPTVLPGQEATEMEGVGIVQKLDEIVPSDLAFTNSNGEPVTIADFMGGEQPFILTLNYYRCPMLCSLTLNGMIDGPRELDRTEDALRPNRGRGGRPAGRPGPAGVLALPGGGDRHRPAQAHGRGQQRVLPDPPDPRARRGHRAVHRPGDRERLGRSPDPPRRRRFADVARLFRGSPTALRVVVTVKTAPLTGPPPPPPPPRLT